MIPLVAQSRYRIPSVLEVFAARDIRFHCAGHMLEKAEFAALRSDLLRGGWHCRGDISLYEIALDCAYCEYALKIPGGHVSVARNLTWFL